MANLEAQYCGLELVIGLDDRHEQSTQTKSLNRT